MTALTLDAGLSCTTPVPCVSTDANRPKLIDFPRFSQRRARGVPEIKARAKEFVAEESSHVAELQKWMAAHKAGQLLPVDR